MTGNKKQIKGIFLFGGILLISIIGNIVSAIVFTNTSDGSSCNEYKQKIIILEKKIAELEKNGYSTSNMDENSRRVMKNINDFIANYEKDNRDYPGITFQNQFINRINNFEETIFITTYKKKGKNNKVCEYKGKEIFSIIRGARKGNFTISNFDTIINKKINSDTIHITIVN